MKRYIKGFIVIIILVIVCLFGIFKFSPTQNIKNKIYKEYGLKTSISEVKKEKNNIYKCVGTIDENNIKFNIIYKKDKLSYEIISTDVENKFHKFLSIKLKEKHSNLSIEGNCYVLSYKNFKDIPEAFSALEHITTYLQKQSYFKLNGNICFIKVVFEESVNKNATSTEFVYGKIKESSMDYYKNKIYSKDTVISKIENNYIEGTKLFNKEDNSINADKIQLSNNVIICGDKGASRLENYKGYFTFDETIKILQDLKIEVIGNEESFIVLSNGSTFEFSKSFIDGPHTYYVLDGNKELLSTSENLISPLIFEKITPIHIKIYNVVSEVKYNGTNIATPFYMNMKKNEPYLSVHDLPNLLKELKIDLKTFSLYEKPFISYSLKDINYEFDLSFSKHYRNQKGYFINDDNYFFKKNTEEYPLGKIVNNELSLEMLTKLTDLEFDYDITNHIIEIK